MTRLSHVVSACAGAVVAGALFVGIGLGPSQGTGAGGSKPTPPVAPKATPPTPPKATPPGGAATAPGKEKVPAPQDPGKPGMVPMPPEMAAAMEFMQPGPQHEWLAQRVGTWNGTGKMFMAPDAPPTEFSGVSTFKMGLGGRYLMEEVKSTMMGEPFEGFGITAFNNHTKKFEVAWCDSMGTAITGGAGTRSADGKTLNISMPTFEPMSGKDVTMRMVQTVVDPDTFTMEMFGPGPNGTEMKMMEMTYRRKKQ